MAATTVRLGVNIDHVATLRQLRDTPYPDVLAAARECIAGGADQITIHLREDRRHINDGDVAALKAGLKGTSVDINLEMAATEEMLAIALKTRPHSICVVPEKREERTTEGGLDLSNSKRNELLAHIASEARKAGIVVSFFIEPDARDMEISKKLGATAVELHTGALCIAHQKNQASALEVEWKRLHGALGAGPMLNLMVNAGHGIDYRIAPELGRLKGIVEYNIGHAIVCEAVFCGLREATRKMKAALLGDSAAPSGAAAHKGAT
ncbi:MAG: pyridoxine 5'-phosphate synthase [Deltaproteobacteria bacterium]|nr:pyridoxine 5'-phosphate synthase [Deltaproteobacteria bacterium]